MEKLTRFKIIGEEIKSNGWAFGAEIGVWKGDTFFYLLDNFPKLKMIGVDQWKTYQGVGNKYTTGYKEYLASIKDVGYQVIKKAKSYGERAKIYHMPSLDAAEHIEDKSLDFVFIDGDHRTSFVRADIAAWGTKVKKGGKIIGHDWCFSSVMKALEVLDPGHLELIDYDHVWMIKK